MPKIVILFFVALAGGLGACLLVDVSWGVYLYQLNYFLYPRSRWWASYIPDLRYSYIIGAVLVIAYILQYRKYTNNNIFEAPQSKWLLLDALNFAFISAWAVWPEQQFKFLEVHFKLLVFLFIAYKVIDTPEKFERMMWAFLAGCFYTGWFAHDAGRTPEGRLEGFGPPDCGNDGNLAAIVLVVSIPILIFYLIKGRNWQRFISLLFLAYIMDAIVLVNSRGAFVGLAASIGYLTFFSVIFSRQPSFMQRFLLLGGIFTGICVFLYMADQIFWDRMFSVKDYAEMFMEGEGRALFWRKGIELSAEYPMGLGTYGYQFFSPQMMSEEYLSRGYRAVHSMYFECLVERGYHGFIIFACLVVSNFRFLRKVRNYLAERREQTLYYQALAIESAFIGFLVSSLFVDRLHSEMLYWCMLFIACFGRIYLRKMEAEETV